MTSSIGAPPSNPARVEPGQVLAGKYRVERVLGMGGMGIVFSAQHLELDERVAVKLMLPEALADADAVGRFLREAKAAVRIKSEHVARVSDVGRLETGEPYLVMEYLEGTDLDGWLRTRGPLTPEDAAEFVIQACEALAEAHSLGIVHRDLKPSNLFCVRRADGLLAIKVLDFGISKLGSGSGASDFRPTKTKSVLGSPLYMSPEQLESSRQVDARGDIWALGAVLYELLTGNPPFIAESLPGLVLRITQHEPMPVRSVRPELPLAFESVLRCCLQKDRNRRYQNVAELAEALAPFAPKRAQANVERARRVIDAAQSAVHFDRPPSSDDRSLAVTVAGNHVATQSSFGHTSGHRGGSGRVRYALFALLAVSALSIGAFWLRRAPSSPSPELPRASAESVAAPLPAPSVSVVAQAELEAVPSASALPSASPAPIAKARAKKAAPGRPTTAAKSNPLPINKLHGLIEDRN